MKLKGSISIYLSIILIGVLLVVSVISESARINAVQTQSKGFAYMALDSVMAGYGKQIYDDYGILLVWEKEPVEEQVKKYIQANINMADLNLAGSNLMGTTLLSADVEEIEYATDKEGDGLTGQIISYMKYASVLEAADTLLSRFKKYQKGSETENSDNEDVTDIVDKDSEELQDIVNNINKSITKLKDVTRLNQKISVVSQKTEKMTDTILSGDKVKDVQKFLKEYRELITELDMEASDVDSAIILIKRYERKKEQFLKENGYTSDAGDYIDDILKNLESVKDIIEDIEKLGVSDFNDIDSSNINTVITAVNNAETVKNKLKSLQVNEATEKDRENQSFYKRAKEFLNTGILSLVAENVSQLSNASISASNLPIQLKKTENTKSLLDNTKNKAILALYANMKFGNYLNLKNNSCLKYELEYIIGGECNDKDNLKKTVEKLVMARNLMNAAYLITDKVKMAEISAVAFSVATAMCLPFLEPAIKAVLIEAWSLAESVNDVKLLLRGEKIQLIKKSGNWRTSLKHLAASGNMQTGDKKGFNYVTYCEILIMLQDSHNCIYRIMDLMQVNIQNKYNKNFLMTKCFQKVKVKINFKTKLLFTAMPWTVKLLSDNEGAYEYSVECSKKY